MEEMEVQDKPGLFGRIAGLFVRERELEMDEPVVPASYAKKPAVTTLKPISGHRVTIRRQIVAFEDAYEAAQGLRRGEQQVLNLSSTDAVLREKIKDFMYGVSFAQDALYEEIGEHIFLFAPSFVNLEVAPPSPRMTAGRN